MKLQQLQEARHIANIHPVIKWIERVFTFAQVNSLMSAYVNDPEEAIEVITKKYGPAISIGFDWSEWNIETDVNGGRLYHLEVTNSSGQINLTRVI